MSETTPLIGSPKKKNVYNCKCNGYCKTNMALYLLLFIILGILGTYYLVNNNNHGINGNESIINDSDELFLITDNPNDYLCDTNIVKSVDDISHHFACLYETDTLQCKPGYSLNCVVEASYGVNIAGGSCDTSVFPNGCGITNDELSECNGLSCSGIHSGEISCLNENNFIQSNIKLNSPCQDCVSLCRCNMNRIQFGNVADCYGDTDSQACIGDELKYNDVVYMPQNLWDFCHGKHSCKFELTGNHIIINTNEGKKEYYNSLLVTDNYNKSIQSKFENFNIFKDREYKWKYKMLAICTKDN